MSTIEIFKAGKQRTNTGREIEFTAEDLAKMAAAYDPALHEAPLVVGHPKTNDPAYGWTKALAVDKNGKLVATPHNVDPEFAEMVKKGTHFKKVSASFYEPDSPSNPKPGVYYLRHIGFLGAQAPAVKGLRDASFASDEQGVIEFSGWGMHRVATFFRRVREFVLEKFSPEDADRVLPSWELESLESEAARELADENRSAAPAFSEQQHKGDEMAAQAAADALEKEKGELAEKQKKLDEREQQVAKREAEAAKAGHASFAEELVKKGQLLPRQRAGLIEVLALVGKDSVIEFSEGDKPVKKSALEFLKELFAELPKQVDFSEQSADDGKGAGARTADPKVLAAKARAFQAEQAKLGIDVSIVDAVEAVSK